jgi:heme-degrading monooxygenase HmoA
LINIGLYYKVKFGHEKEFEKSFSDALSSLRNGHPGFLGGRLYKEVGDSQEYMLYTEWDGLDSFRKFMESKEYASTVEFGKTIIEGAPRHRFFEIRNS